MPLEILTVPCLSDNYAFIAHDKESGETTVIDVPEAAPILSTLQKHGWQVNQVLLTHHHADHVQGLDELLASHPAKVVGARSDAHRLPPLDIQVDEGDTVRIGDQTGHVIAVPGHTLGHIAFHFPDSKAAFTADSLMALGCGRVVEGTMPQMWESLQKLATLPDDTIIYSGHEYTQANGAFALTIEPDNPDLISRVEEIAQARAQNRPMVPSPLQLELKTNPFLRADQPSVQTALGMKDAAPADVFAEIRTRKDRF